MVSNVTLDTYAPRGPLTGQDPQFVKWVQDNFDWLSKLRDYVDTLALESDVSALQTRATTDEATIAGLPTFSELKFRNKLRNAAFRLDQRNNGAVYLNPSQTIVDRWLIAKNGLPSLVWSAQRSAGPVALDVNYPYYLAISITTKAASQAAGDYLVLEQRMPGLDLVDLAYGTALARPLNFRFYANYPYTGLFGGSIRNWQTGGTLRSYPFTFNVPAANTWTKYSIPIPTDPASGLIVLDANAQFDVILDFGAGSTYKGAPGGWSAANYLGATGAQVPALLNPASYYFTGFQLELDEETPFDLIPFDIEQLMAWRYYYRRNFAVSEVVANLQAYTSTGAFGKLFDLPTKMRATPTVGISSPAHFGLSTVTGGSSTNLMSAAAFTNSTQNEIQLWTSTTPANLVAGNCSVMVTQSASAWIDASADI
jgi:hypothetical protein